MPSRIAHIITDLNPGGAEWMLHRLVLAPMPTPIEHVVVSLTGVGPVGESLRARGVRVEAVHLDERPVRGMRALVRHLRDARPDAVQTWMYHANLAGGIAARLAGCRAILWSIHHTDLDPGITRPRTRLVNRACALLSRRLPRHVVYCAESSRSLHLALGYASRGAVVVPNGFELPPDFSREGARADLRARLGLPPAALVVARAGRYHPQKDFAGFVKAAARAARLRGDLYFVLWGTNVDEHNEALASLVRDSGMAGRFRLLGYVEDSHALLGGIDVMASSSESGEAFPLVLGEAMARSVPCVATDVGDCASIVGDTGAIVPRRDPAALADAFLRMAALPPEEREALGERARRRVEERYALAMVASRYAELWTGRPAAPDRPPELPAPRASPERASKEVARR